MATVLQMVHTNITAQSVVAIPAGVWTNIPVSLGITPTSAASVIKIQAVINGDRQLANVAPLCWRLLRNGTPIGIGVGGGVVSYGRFMTSVFFNPYLFVDSPASVALLTYQFQAFDASGNTVYINRDSPASFSGNTTLILQEIG